MKFLVFLVIFGGIAYVAGVMSGVLPAPAVPVGMDALEVVSGWLASLLA